MCRWPLRPAGILRPASITAWTRCRSSGDRKRSRFFTGKCSMPKAGLRRSSSSRSAKIHVNRLLAVASMLFAAPGVSFILACSSFTSDRLTLRKQRSPNAGRITAARACR